MADSTSGKLRIWEGWAPLLAAPAPRSTVLPAPRLLPGTYQAASIAEELAARETLRWHHHLPEEFQPYSLQWFLAVEHVRHGRQARWIPSLLEFTKHRGEILLGLGHGLGTDWVQYARHGAEVISCCPRADELDAIRRNFQLRGLPARAFVHAQATALPLESASIDVACLTDLLDEGNAASVVDEVYRVLKPGGKVVAVAPARFDVDFWCRRCLPWLSWLRPQSPPAEPAPAAFSARGLRRLFARFCESRVWKRQLRRAEVPHVWRWMPLAMLERLMGRFLVFKAFKPLSAAMGEQAAA
jgi:ubiquinone/menaquinone biosynthesis C-methylase UbiE